MIELINVSKYYPTDQGRHYVFRNVNLVLPPDKSVGVIGPNGAGKSTFLRLIAGADKPNEGRIVRTGRISPPMGLTPGLVATLTGSENVRFACRIQGTGREEMESIVEQVRALADIGKYFDMPVLTYSSGMRQRVGFAISMSIHYDYYLFDEIGAGGDRKFRETSKRMVEDRLKTSKFIITSHRLDELIGLCEAGIVIMNGELRYFDDIRDALAYYGEEADIEIKPREQKRSRRDRDETDPAGEPLTPVTDVDTLREERRAARAALKAAKQLGLQPIATDSASLAPVAPAEDILPEASVPDAEPAVLASPDERAARREALILRKAENRLARKAAAEAAAAMPAAERAEPQPLDESADPEPAVADTVDARAARRAEIAERKAAKLQAKLALRAGARQEEAGAADAAPEDAVRADVAEVDHGTIAPLDPSLPSESRAERRLRRLQRLGRTLPVPSATPTGLEVPAAMTSTADAVLAQQLAALKSSRASRLLLRTLEAGEAGDTAESIQHFAELAASAQRLAASAAANAMAARGNILRQVDAATPEAEAAIADKAEMKQRKLERLARLNDPERQARKALKRERQRTARALT